MIPVQPEGELLLREVLKAKPQAEQACQEATAVDRSVARKILHRRCEPYNQKATHALSMTDDTELVQLSVFNVCVTTGACSTPQTDALIRLA